MTKLFQTTQSQFASTHMNILLARSTSDLVQRNATTSSFMSYHFVYPTVIRPVRSTVLYIFLFCKYPFIAYNFWQYSPGRLNNNSYNCISKEPYMIVYSIGLVREIWKVLFFFRVTWQVHKQSWITTVTYTDSLFCIGYLLGNCEWSPSMFRGYRKYVLWNTKGR